MDSIHFIKQAAMRFASATMLSRLTGVIRDILMALFFGTEPLIAIFMIAFRLSHFLRRLLGEGAMHAAFMPIYAGLHKETPLRALLFFNTLRRSLFKLLLCIVLVVEGVLGISLLLHSFEQRTTELIYLLMILFPSLLFIVLAALNSSYLNFHHSFFRPAIAPACFNLVWIFALLFLPSNVYLLALFVLLGYLLHLIITRSSLPMLPKNSSESLRPLYQPLFLGIFGMAAVQINSAIDPLFAAAGTLEGPAYLWYAIRLQQLPMALISLALSSALLPSLSSLIEHHDENGYKTQLRYGISRSLFFMIPITALTLLLAPFAINLLFGHGAFHQTAIIQSSYALFAYTLGLIPMTLTQLFSIALFAHKSYKIPAIASTLSVVLSLMLNTLFIFYYELGAYSVALSTSIAALFNALLLFYYLPCKPSFPIKEIIPTLAATVVASTLTLLIEPLSLQLLQGRMPLFPTHLLEQAYAFALPLLLFSTLFFLSLKAFTLLIPKKA